MAPSKYPLDSHDSRHWYLQVTSILLHFLVQLLATGLNLVLRPRGVPENWGFEQMAFLLQQKRHGVFFSYDFF